MAKWILLLSTLAAILHLSSQQAAKCDVPCLNGYCKAPGSCKCFLNFGGPSCDIERPPRYYERNKRTQLRKPIFFFNSTSARTEPRMINFRSDCLCQNGGVCDENCKCEPGWTGKVCETECQPYRVGLNCTQTCGCLGNGKCDHVTGNCVCSFDKFGTNCTETCSCVNEAICDSATGRCRCSPGWTGLICSERICPENKYGDDCTRTCDCDETNTESCHPHDGKCKCKPGFNTTNCGLAKTHETLNVGWDDYFNDSTLWIFSCIMFFVIFASITALIFFFYQRRVKKLRREFSYAVKYLSRECNHIDNPEYTLQESFTKRVVERNEKKSLKPGEVERSSNIYEDPSFCTISASSGSASEYQIIEDHLYDEIAKKYEINEPDPEYDHLDHSRPNQKLHPIYHHAIHFLGPSHESLDHYENPVHDKVIPETDVTLQS